MWKWIVALSFTTIVGVSTLFAPRGAAQQPYPLIPFQCPAGQFTYAFNPVTGGLPGWFCATPGATKQINTPPVTNVGDLAVWGNNNGTSLIDNGTAFPAITVANNNALKALPIPVAGTVAYRAGFYSAGDGGGATYTFAATNCSISGGDNGSQVQPTIGTGCWIASFNNTQASAAVWGVSTSVSDNSAALQAAVTATISDNIALFIPAGTYQFASLISGTIASGQAYSILGAGQNLSILKSTGTVGGIKLNYTDKTSGLTVANGSILPAVANAGTGLSLVMLASSIPGEGSAAATEIQNLTLAAGAGGTSYWTTAFAESGVSNINFDGVSVNNPQNVAADGFNLSGPSSSAFSVAINFNGTKVTGGQYGVIYGPFIQGVNLVNANFCCGKTSILVIGGAGDTLLSIMNSQMGLNTAHFIDLEGPIGGVSVIGNNFNGLPSGFAGVYINSTSAHNLTITGNQFSPISANTAIGVSSVLSSRSNLFEGNSCLAVRTCIALASGTQGFTIGPNIYAAGGLEIVDNASDTVYTNAQLVDGSTGTTPVVGGGGPVHMSIGPVGTTTQGLNMFAPSTEVINITGCHPISAFPGTGQTYTSTLMDNNIATSLTCTLSGISGNGVVAGPPVTISAGDVWEILVTPSTGAAMGGVMWSGTIRPVP